ASGGPDTVTFTSTAGAGSASATVNISGSLMPVTCSIVTGGQTCTATHDGLTRGFYLYKPANYVSCQSTFPCSALMVSFSGKDVTGQQYCAGAGTQEQRLWNLYLAAYPAPAPVV